MKGGGRAYTHFGVYGMLRSVEAVKQWRPNE